MRCLQCLYNVCCCCCKYKPWRIPITLWKDPIWKHFILIYLATFFIVLPILCFRLKNSFYYIQETQIDGEKRLKAENDLRLKTLLQYRKSVDYNAVKSMLVNDGPVDLSVSIITARRNNPVGDLYQTKYVTQVVWTFLQSLLKAQKEGFMSHLRLSVCNVDPEPDLHHEALSLASVVPVVSRFSNSSEIVEPEIFEKEKQDYLFCLKTARMSNPRYVLLLEDDALPNDDFFTVLEHVIHNHLDHKISKGEFTKTTENITYIKLYHAERLQGFISLEQERLPELFGLSTILGTLLTFLYLLIRSRKNGCTQDRVTVIWLCFIVYAALVLIVIDRPNINAVRRTFSPNLYSYTKAPHCCTPAMLFPAPGARVVTEYLRKIKCYVGFAKDTALFDLVSKHGYSARMVQPNLVTHIGLYSSIRNKILNPFVV